MQRSVALIVALATVPACGLNLEIPPESAIECDADADCPAGYVCKPAIDRCIEAGVSDAQAPTVVPGSVAVAPSRAREGVDVTVSFEVSEPLARAPEVRLGTATSVIVASAGGDETTWSITLQPQLSMGEGTWPLYVSLVDRSGNDAPSLTLADVVFDFTAPEVLELAADRVVYKAGERVAVTFRLDEPASSTTPPRVTVEGGGVMQAEPGPTADVFQFGYDVPAGAPTGPVTFTLNVADVAGNSTQRLLLSAFDTSAPVVSEAQVLTDFVSETGTATVTFSADEPLTGVQVSLVPQQGGQTLPMTDEGAVGTLYGFSRPILVGDADGPYDVVMSAATDEAGNAVAGLPMTLGSLVIDKVAPTFVARPAADRAPAIYPAGSRVSVSFEVSEELDGLPVATLATSTPIALPCVLDAPRIYTCTQEGTLDAGAVTSGAVLVQVSVVDLAGHRAEDAASVSLDFVAPELQAPPAPTQLLPAVTNMLVTLGRLPLAARCPETPSSFTSCGATTGTTVSVSFGVSELLAAPPVVRVVPSGGSFATGIAMTHTAGTTYVYTWTVPAGATEGPYTVVASFADLAGNSVDEVVIPNAEFDVDTQTPNFPAVFTPGAVVYRRAPWGTTNYVNFDVVGQAGAVDAHVLVAAYADADGNSRIGLTAADGDGAFSVTLDPVDRARVWIRAIDSAGNYGYWPFQVRDVEWIATLAMKVPGSTLENPHVLREHRWFNNDLSAAGGNEIGGATVSTVDGQNLSTSGGGSWREFTASAGLGARFAPSMVYDSARGRVVLLGGGGSSQVMEWNGAQWARVIPRDPEGDGEPNLQQRPSAAYDPVRGVTVVFNHNETWEYDGSSWKKLSQFEGGYPNRRWGAALAFDPRAGTMLMFGGSDTINCTSDVPYNGRVCGGTYLFTSGSWFQQYPSTSPEARWGHAMVYDEARERIVMYGGCLSGTGPSACIDPVNNDFTDVWEWYRGTGEPSSTWHRVTPTGAQRPPALFRPTLTYDSTNQRVLMYGGCPVNRTNNWDGSCTEVPSSQLWTWDGAQFSPISTVDPEKDAAPFGRHDHGAAYDAAREQLVVAGGVSCYESPSPFCGASGETRSDTWVLKEHRGAGWSLVGESWQRVGPSGTAVPTARANMSMTYDSARGRIVLFSGQSAGGGSLNDTWEWTGYGWEQRVASGVAGSPSGRRFFGLAYDATIQRTLLVGGDYNGGEVWTWNGAAWTQLTLDDPQADGNPHAPNGTSTNAALVYDAARGSTVLFGGMSSTGVASNDIWRLAYVSPPSASSWVKVTPGTVPPHAFNPVAGYDATGDGRVVWITTNGPDMELWGWTGTWSNLHTWSTGSGPKRPLNYWLAPQGPIVHDSGRGKVVSFFGGDPPVAGTWEWDGSAWRSVVTSDPDGDFDPAPRFSYGLAADTGREVAVLFGGITGNTVLAGPGRDDTWIWDGGARARPAHVAAINFYAAGVRAPDNVRINGVSARWVAGGAGTVDGAPETGAELLVWDRGAWREVASTTSATPDELVWTTTDAAQLGTSMSLGRLFRGPAQTLHFAARPSARNGNGAAHAQVTTNYVEVAVRYRFQ